MPRAAMPADKCAVILLAAGKGTRMVSDLPKVMHKIAGEPMIVHCLRASNALNPSHMVVVLAPGMEKVQETVKNHYPKALFAVQHEQLGTGHAVKAGMEALADFQGDVLVLYSDNPLFTPETLAGLMERKRTHKATVALLGMRPSDPTGYGRLVLEGERVERIVECKDALAEEKKLPWVWGGVMAFESEFLRYGLAALTPSVTTQEYYLTSLVEMASTKDLGSLMVPVATEEALGVNSRAQLAEAEYAMQNRLRALAMASGATLVAPETIFLSADTKLGRDTVVQPHVVFGPGVTIAERVEIRSFSHLQGVQVAEGCIIGPFARLRPGTQLAEGVHVGNFVEVKVSRVEAGAKINHLAYIGDASVGKAANIGAGTITCNYDGIAKHRTIIGAGAFIGSNASLVAPVAIGAGAVVGAGSVITEDVPADTLAIERNRQITKIRHK